VGQPLSSRDLREGNNPLSPPACAPGGRKMASLPATFVGDRDRVS
jgi:hypothetical protein